MGRVLMVLVLVGAGVVGLGWYAGWFQFSSGSTDGKVNIGVTLDKDKIHEDEKKAQQKLHNMEDRLKGKAATGKTKDESAPLGPPSKD